MVVRRSLIGWSGQSFRQSSKPTPIPSNPQHKTKRPTQPREPDPHHQRTERDSERGERVIWMDLRGELVVRRLDWKRKIGDLEGEEIKRDVKGKKLEGYFGIIQNKCLFRCLFKITKTP